VKNEKCPDENDLLKAGDLPEDPEAGTLVVDDGPRLVTVKEMLAESLKRAVMPRNKRTGTTGNTALDRITGGMRPGITWVVMAETSWGKTSFTISMADENLKNGHRVLICSTEDAPGMYGDRLLARRARIDATHVRDGCLTPEELTAAADVAGKGQPVPVYLDAIGKSAQWLLRHLPLLIKEYAIDIVVVDYIQEIYSEKRHESRRLELTWIAREIRATCKRLGVCAVICSQITCEDGKRPTKTDVRDSKDIVSGSEVVLIGFTPEKDLSTKSVGMIEAGTKVALIDKNKDGPKGLVPLNWDEKSACFLDDAVSQMIEEANNAFDGIFDEF
jgi:replicative DNA helicase